MITARWTLLVYCFCPPFVNCPADRYNLARPYTGVSISLAATVAVLMCVS
jgi:hypothetical protein